MIVKAPESYSTIGKITVFLAGSIEMGTAEKWQDKVSESIDSSNVVILNPRRDDWDSSWKQSINDPKFNEQVEWELDGLDNCDITIFYFDPETKSPITLLELGMQLEKQSSFIFVCCPEGFWRKGNVEMVCDRYQITPYTDLDKLLSDVKMTIRMMKNDGFNS